MPWWTPNKSTSGPTGCDPRSLDRTWHSQRRTVKQHRWRYIWQIWRSSSAQLANEKTFRAARRTIGFVVGSLTPIMLYMMFFSLLPMIWALILGFFDYSPVRLGSGFFGLGSDNPFIGLDNYRAMFGRDPTGAGLPHGGRQYLHFALLVLPINLAITLPLAVLVESVHRPSEGHFPGDLFSAHHQLGGGGGDHVGLHLPPPAGLAECNPQADRDRPPKSLADRSKRRLPGHSAGNDRRDHRLHLAGFRLQPGDLHRRPAGHPA